MPSPVSGAGEKDSLIADLALSTFALWLSRSPVDSGPAYDAYCSLPAVFLALPFASLRESSSLMAESYCLLR